MVHASQRSRCLLKQIGDAEWMLSGCCVQSLLPDACFVYCFAANPELAVDLEVSEDELEAAAGPAAALAAATMPQAATAQQVDASGSEEEAEEEESSGSSSEEEDGGQGRDEEMAPLVGADAGGGPGVGNEDGELLTAGSAPFEELLAEGAGMEEEDDLEFS